MLNSILATGYALRTMPDDRTNPERFTVREWAQNRQGWLFLPNTADTRDALRPLQSAWVDMAMLRVMSSLEEFDFSQAPQVLAARIHQLAQGGYIQKAEPLVFVGEPGTGKTHLATGFTCGPCRHWWRARFTTATALVNELVEAKHINQLSRALGRWSRYELIVIDELGYIPLAEVAAELLLQVIADRAEKAAVIVTTNLPQDPTEQVMRLTVMIDGKLGDSGVIGSGIIFAVSANRIYIATANHVVHRADQEASDIRVQFRWLPGEKFAAR